MARVPTRALRARWRTRAAMASQKSVLGTAPNAARSCDSEAAAPARASELDDATVVSHRRARKNCVCLVVRACLYDVLPLFRYFLRGEARASLQRLVEAPRPWVPFLWPPSWQETNVWQGSTKTGILHFASPRPERREARPIAQIGALSHT